MKNKEGTTQGLETPYETEVRKDELLLLNMKISVEGNWMKVYLQYDTGEYKH
jgi:hypothetical protein